MADQPPFDPDDDDVAAPASPSEGVRLIKPDEAAEAVERGDAVRRRGGDRPRYGDRPEAPDGPRPNLRFPLADSADPTLIVRPKVAPVDPPQTVDPQTVDPQTVGPQTVGPQTVDPQTVDPQTVDPPGVDVPGASSRAPRLDFGGGEEAADAALAPLGPGDPSPIVRPAPGRRKLPPDTPPPIVTAEELGAASPAARRPDPAPASPRPADVEEPLLSLPISESTELPHWTEPATGEVPRVLIGDLEDVDEEARWSSFADQGPRWRDQASGEWDPDDTGVAHLIADPEDEQAPLGALDTSVRLSDEEFLTFDDLDVPRQEVPTARPRGSLDDPISIQSEPARPARPTAPGQREASPAPRSRTAPRRPARTPDGRDGAPAEATAPSPSESAGRDVPTAILVGIAIATFALILFKAGPRYALGLVFVVVVLAGAEFFSAVRRGGFRPATLLGLAAIAALPLATYWRGESAIPLVLFLLTVFTALWFILGLGPDATANLGVTVLGAIYVGVFGSYAALMLKVPVQGVSILLVTVVGAVAYDVGGFFVGRRLGRTQLTSVSPNKTVEGLAGGMLTSVVAVALFAGPLGFGPFDLGQAIAFGVFIAFAAPAGDLAESVMKRDLGLKDMGSILPEHGGILDRFDALLFVLPTAYYVARALDLVGA